MTFLINQYRGRIINITIGSSTNDINLRTLANSNSYGGEEGATINVTINGGVTVGSSSPSTAALIRGTFPASCTINLIINGSISGAGGAGAGTSGTATAGGTALDASAGAINVINNGTIAGGGGGGGRGATRSWSDGKNGGTAHGGQGGGGAGTIVGPRGNSGSGNTGNHGTSSSGGSGGGGQSNGTASSGAGGAGGALGTAGNSGGSGSSGSVDIAANSGGAAGNAVVGNSNINWLATGTRTGPIT